MSAGRRPGDRRAAPATAGRPAAGRRASAAHAGEVRIVGGQWRRSRLPVATVDGLRPTPDRVRETLFNWLGQDLAGWRCCDPFAGSGALGLEAASRGAARVLLVEREPALARSLQATVARLGGADRVTVRCGDGLAALRALPPGSQELVFLDPPYGSALLQPAVAAARAALVPGGWLYVEDRAPWSDEDPALSPVRRQRAGLVHATLLRRVAEETGPAHTLAAP